MYILIEELPWNIRKFILIGSICIGLLSYIGIKYYENRRH